MRKTDPFECPDEVPAHIYLPPFQAKSRRIRVPVVISMPVLAPGRELQRTEPPQVLGRFAVLAKFSHVGDAIDEALQVQRVDQAYRTNPEERLPAEGESSED